MPKILPKEFFEDLKSGAFNSKMLTKKYGVVRQTVVNHVKRLGINLVNRKPVPSPHRLEANSLYLVGWSRVDLKRLYGTAGSLVGLAAEYLQDLQSGKFTAHQIMEKYGCGRLTIRKSVAVCENVNLRINEDVGTGRRDRMKVLYASGLTHQEIGDIEGITRQRVLQIISSKEIAGTVRGKSKISQAMFDDISAGMTNEEISIKHCCCIQTVRNAERLMLGKTRGTVGRPSKITAEMLADIISGKLTTRKLAVKYACTSSTIYRAIREYSKFSGLEE